MSFSIHKLIQDVFSPAPFEKVAVLVDLPHGSWADDTSWKERRAMAEQWRRAFLDLPVFVYPLITFPATGGNNADLPAKVLLGEDPFPLEALLADTNILLAFTRFSATAPLSMATRRFPGLRVASMPGVLKRMEKTALSADYREVARRVHLLAERLTRADWADVVFATGDRCHFDLRHRRGMADDGCCHADSPSRLINLPSGEAFIVPYEGEREGEPSTTEGWIPVLRNTESMRLRIEANRIVHIEGGGPEAEKMRTFFDQDPARRNVAELGLGCNEAAVISGSVLEDEKAGFHWAFGRSEHLGGQTGPDAFLSHATVVHQDIVYAKGCPVEILSLNLENENGYSELLIREGEYTL